MKLNIKFGKEYKPLRTLTLLSPIWREVLLNVWGGLFFDPMCFNEQNKILKKYVLRRAILLIIDLAQ
jgi:hypothetical protein